MKVILAGDSWSQGEWGCTECVDKVCYHVDTYGVRHKGLEQYLLDAGHEVLNVGQGGYNVNDSIQAISLVDVSEYDRLYWFHPPAVKDLVTRGEKFLKVEDLLVALKQRTQWAYDKLGELPIDVYIIGGSDKAKTDGLSDNSTVLIESLVEFLSDELVHPDPWMSHGAANQIKDVSASEEVIEYLIEQFEHAHAIKLHEEYFQPDGFHINRKGHKRLFEYIVNGR